MVLASVGGPGGLGELIRPGLVGGSGLPLSSASLPTDRPQHRMDHRTLVGTKDPGSDYFAGDSREGETAETIHPTLYDCILDACRE